MRTGICEQPAEVLLLSVQIVDFLGEKRHDNVTLDLKRRRQQPSFDRPWLQCQMHSANLRISR